MPPPPHPDWPRYCRRPFPAYSYVPGTDPHPRRDPKGYAYGQREVPPPLLTPDNWCTHDEYLHGIDLYNFAYWWACHESLEGCWHVAGHATTTGQFLQGIIQVAAGNLKKFMRVDEGAQRLRSEGLARLAAIPDTYCGVDVRAFERDVRGDAPALIRLVGVDPLK